ncbi:MAG: hypothetical protein SGILL_001771 [Bacillariaceae sp.]
MIARSIGAVHQSRGAVFNSKLYSATTGSSSLPDIDALATAPFMQQVQYGMDLAEMLQSETDKPQEQLKESLKAQLSHSDGIRGFMVAYLSGRDASGESNMIPPILLDALKEQLQQPGVVDLVSLMCMNVVMPTAMVTMHENAENSAASARTAKQGAALLKAVKDETPALKENLRAIQAVARVAKTGGKVNDDDRLLKTWTAFFEKWGYQEQQAKDIEEAMNQILS